MNAMSRAIGAGALAALVLIGTVGLASAQPPAGEPSPVPTLPPPPEEKDTPKLAPVKTGSEQPTEPFREVEVPIKDVINEATDGRTPNNPTGRQEPGVGIEWLYPSAVRLSQPVTCTLVVKSLSTNRLHQVVVRARVPAAAQIRGCEPKGSVEGDIVTWHIGNMEPREERRLDLNLMPVTKGSLLCHAFVTFTGSSSAKLEVREPKLAIKAVAPPKVISGDLTTIAFTVSNPGDAKADHVKVRVALSDGLEYGTAKATEFTLDSLGPTESRTVLLQCRAKANGEQVCTAVANAEGNLEAQTTAAVTVVNPAVDVAVSGPKMRYLDRHAIFVFKVTNPGTAPANHVTLSNQVPAGFKVIGATDGGHHDFATSTVVWFLGNLNPGQSKEVTLDLLAINPGEYKNQVTVSAARGLRAATEVFTRIEGLPGLLMELVDVEDPVEMGKDISYEIRLSNTGTKTETSLQLRCMLPEQMELRGAKCTVGIPYRIEGREIVFAPIPRLAPRADIIYRVNVRCQAPGDFRFQARVNADGLMAPVLREESTRVFGDDREVITGPKKQ